MASRVTPLMWPLLVLASPVLVPKMLRRNRIFKENRSRAESLNRQRIDGAQHLDLPELEFLELTVLVDEKTGDGFRGDPGVSYLVTTELITGCGHPTVEVILEMVGRLSNEPIYAIAGGIHFPVTKSRSQRRGIQVQMFFGTGKPPWQRISDDDLGRTIEHMNEAGPTKALLSAHDTCDHALARMTDELNAETMLLKAGEKYRL